MEKEKFSLSKKIFYLFFILSISNYHLSFSQCVTGDPIQEFCAINKNTVSNLVVTSGINVVWFDAPIGGIQFPTSTLLVNGNSYYAQDLDPSCTDPTRFQVTVNIYGKVPTGVDVFVGKCASEEPTIADLSATAPGIIEWYSDQTGGTLLNNSTVLVNGQTYWVQQTENGCISSRLPTTVSLIDPPAPTVSPTQSFCSSPNPTVGDLQALESNVVWYDSENSTIPLDVTTNLVHGEDYWAAQNTFPCESTVRILTTVQIDAIPIAGTDGSYSDCESNLVTTDLFTLLGGTPSTSGTWSGPSTLSGGNLGTFTPGVNVEGIYTYSVSSTLGVCPSESASVTVTIIVIPPPTITDSSQAFCETEAATVNDLLPSGVLWYDAQTNGNLLNATDSLVNGATYWAAQPDATTGCESLNRNSVTATIIVIPPPTITDSSQAFCETEAATVNDLLPSGVLWYDAQTNGNLLNATDSLVNGATYWAAQPDATTGCESLNRNSVTATIIVIPPPTITDSSQAFCETEAATVNDLLPSGVLWYDAQTNGNLLNATDSLVNGATYWAAQPDATTGCESLNRNSVTATIIVIPPPTITDSSQAFCETEAATVNDLLPSGVLWYDAQTNGNLLNATDSLVNGATYWAAQPDATTGCESLNRNSVTATIIVIPPPTITDSSQAFCETEAATVNDLLPSGVLWYDAQTNGNLLNATDSLVNGATYWAAQPDATTGCESLNRNSVTATIIVIPPPTITDSSQAFCETEAATVNDLLPSGVLWYDAQTNGNLLNATDSLVNGATYWAAQPDATTGCESLNRNSVTVTIIVIPPPTITDSSQAFCETEAATVNDLLPSGVLWYDAQTNGNLLNATDSLVNGATYWAAQPDATTGCESLNRNSVTVTIIVIPPPTITDSSQAFCETEAATVNDLLPSGVLWYDAQTNGNLLNATDSLVNGATYWAAQPDATTGCESLNRNSVTATIIVIPPPTITDSSQAFCETEAATVNDLLPSGVLWYDAQTNGNLLNATDSLVNGATYWAAQPDATTGCESLNRNSVTATIIVIPPPTITDSSQAFCETEAATVNDLLPSGVLWYDAQTNGNLLNATDSLVNGATYWAAQPDATTGCESLNRNSVTATIIVIPPPTITDSSQAFCETEAATVNDLLPSGVLWYDAQTNGNLLNATDSLVNGATYWAAQPDATTGCESLNRNSVTATIIVIPPPTITDSSQAFCETEAATVNDLLPSGVLWYDAQTNGNLLNATDSLVNGATYWAAQPDATTGCESLNRNSVTATIIVIPPPTITDSSQAFCETEAATVNDLLPSGVLWYDAQTNGNLLNATDSLVNGATYWAAQPDATTGCESLNRNSVTATIIVIPPPTITDSSQAFCETEAATVNDLLPSGVLWYDAQTNGNLLNATDSLVNGATYWAAQPDATTGCESLNRNSVTATIIVIPPPTITDSSQAFCETEAATVNDLLPSGVLWYDAQTNGNLLNATDSLVNGATYWAAQPDATTGCESLNRNSVTATIFNPLTPTTSNPTQSFCLANNPTIANLQAQTSGANYTIAWYADSTSTVAFSLTEPLVNGETYYAAEVGLPGCESALRLMITVIIINEAPPVISNPSQTFCASDNPTIADLQASGSVEWFASETANTPLNLTDPITNASVYWAATKNLTTGCSSSIRVSVNATLIDIATPILDVDGNEFCSIDNPTLSDLNDRVLPLSNGIITWYDAYPNGTALSLAQFLIHEETYYAIETNINGCYSVNPLAVTVDLEACDQYDIVIYDGFSPNGDGLNDTFKIENLRILYPDFKVEIFNRWGSLMYTSDANKPDWNGRLNGDKDFAPSGVYYFIINFNKNNRRPTQGRLYLSL